MRLFVRPRLNEILKERNMTQLELAERAGIPQAAVSRFDRSIQRRDTHLFAIARALGVGVEELFEVSEARDEAGD